MSTATPENPVSTAFAQGADTINPFVAEVAGAGISEQARLAFAPAQEGSLEHAFQRQYGGLVVGRFLLGGYYEREDNDNNDQAQPSFRVDLVDSSIGLPDLRVDITFREVSIGKDVLSLQADHPPSRALYGALVRNLAADTFVVTQRFPNFVPDTIELGRGRFGSIDENKPVAITAGVLLSLGVSAINKASLAVVNQEIPRDLR